jgi:hypothetical protein
MFESWCIFLKTGNEEREKNEGTRVPFIVILRLLKLTRCSAWRISEISG